jgi:ASC-1-like (ASCH) protein
MRTKTLWIKDEYLQMILAGRKTIEVRVGRLQAGDRLLLNGRHAYLIGRIGRYANLNCWRIKILIQSRLAFHSRD